MKFHPIKPASPHLNGKVEHSQHTDLGEFYSSIDLNHSELQQKLQEWESYCNKERPHTSLHGKTPLEKYNSVKDQIPKIEAIHGLYNPSQEGIIQHNYKSYMTIKVLKY